jgi:hypothetical protein
MQFCLFLTGKGRGKAAPTSAMMECRASGDRITLSLNHGPKWEDGWLPSRPGRFTCGEGALGVFLGGGWVGPSADLDVFEKR